MVPLPAGCAGPISRVVKGMADLDLCKMRVFAGPGRADIAVTTEPSPFGEVVVLGIRASTVRAEDARQLLESYCRRPVESLRPRWTRPLGVWLGLAANALGVCSGAV